MDLAGDRKAQSLAIEFGTLGSEKGQQIKRDARRAFYHNKDDWEGMIWNRRREVMTQARDQLAR